jgi:ABC-type sulfate/molybdate transport systems ATPase subunit
VTAGEIFGFLGPNGAGKSTTIGMLCTLVRPTGGHARVAGHDVGTERDDVRRNIGLVFQDTTLDGYLTAEQRAARHLARRPRRARPGVTWFGWRVPGLLEAGVVALLGCAMLAIAVWEFSRAE